MVDAPAESPSVASATATFAVLFFLPIAVFAVSALWTLSQPAQQASWESLAITYLLGTFPGLVVGVRYLKTPRSKAVFGVLYPVVCVGLFFVEGLLIGCLVTDVCL